MLPRSEIVLITRVRTNNKGNQALSSAWVAMLETAFAGAAVRVLERRPHHLLQFPLARFAAARDPFAEFDRVTSALAREAPGPAAAPPLRPPQILLDESITPTPPFAALRKRLEPRRWAARFGRFRAPYRARLAACQRAQLVVINPAGEFFPHDPAPALAHLLDAHVASKLGRPTAIVNHTLDVADPTLRRIIPRLYRELSLVGFRDESSVRALQEMGGDLSNVVLTPDLAITTPAPTPRPRRPGRIAVALHSPDAAVQHQTEAWLGLIEALTRRGFEVALVSNELPSDRAFFDRVQRRLGVPVEGAGLDFRAYAALLGSYDFVVSSRMHTSILAMVVGTPVVPVEPGSFKVSGLFASLGLSTPVIRPTQPGWTEQVLAAAEAMRTQRDQVAREVAERMATARTRLVETLAPRLRAAAGIAAQGAA